MVAPCRLDLPRSSTRPSPGQKQTDREMLKATAATTERRRPWMFGRTRRGWDWKGSPPNPITGRFGPATAEDHLRQTLAALERYNVVKAIVSGPVEVVEQ